MSQATRGRDALSAMFRIADDDEANTLETLAVKAELLWVCGACGYVTVTEERKCCGCGKRRETIKETTP